MRTNNNILCVLLLMLLVWVYHPSAYAQKPDKVGTTAVSIYEIGFSTAGNAMGDARVASAAGLESIYWNPAGLVQKKGNEVMFFNQPWLVEIGTGMAGVAVEIPRVGKAGLSLIYADYGEMEVTTVDQQEGTGEMFTANDYVLALTFARNLATWFSLGVNFEYYSSSIYHVKASAVAADLGVIVKTDFFTTTGKREDGLAIGMSINNYGIPMQYNGKDLLASIDILPNEDGNYKYVPGQYKLSEWELPLIFRIGASVYPIASTHHRLGLEIDAIHPNNNSEYVNLGAEYSYLRGRFGRLFLRGGFKGLFMDDSEYGVSAGAGIELFMLGNNRLGLEYAFRDIGVLGTSQAFSICLGF
jgi:hypothetical protein